MSIRLHSMRLTAAAMAMSMCACGCEAEVQPPPPRDETIPADAVKVTPDADNHPPVLHSNEFLPPEPVSGEVNTAGAEDSAFVLADGNTLYFWFTPDVRVPPEQQVLDGVTGVYVSNRVGGQWSKAAHVPLQKPGELSLDGCVFVQGDEMWFCSVREGNFREIDMWTSRRVEGGWRDWQNAGETLNIEYGVGEMHISPDGRRLYYHSDRPGGVGGRDIWMTEMSQAGWGEPVNVSAVNSPDMDGWPCLSPDGSELWITRTYMGTPALFRSIREGDGWGEPELIVSQFAGEASVDVDGNVYFTHHFFRDGVMIEADIYVVRRVA